MYLKLTAFAITVLFAISGFAQNADLFKLMEQESKQHDEERTSYAFATFKTTRLINGHTAETTGKGVLDVKIAHRFGTVNGGLYDLFGLDNATMRMGFDYGLTQRLSLGLGRSTFQKQGDVFAKYKLLRQSSGKIKMPLTATLLASAMVRTQKEADPTTKRNFSDRLYYAFQVLLARKFSEGFSFQLSPTVVHHNLVPLASNSNDILALGLGGRQKLSRRLSINAEYFLVNPSQRLPNTTNALSAGVDIETGGHVFQLHFTNAQGMTERTFITQTDGRWSDGDIYFGFNISRVFLLHKKKTTTTL